MIVKPVFKWFDFWMGLYWDRDRKILYLFYFPMCGLMISWQRCAGSCNKPIFIDVDGQDFCGERDCVLF